ncbi:MAG: hypothetical protein KAS71_11115 [Bacteroidales bacterium]|nr:hypothetical protein [Bacteroidales bacterium]
MPEQLKRLFPLFAIFIIIFLIIRHLLIPDTFGLYGHYRGDALKDNANIELVYASKEACIECHSDIREMLEMDEHSDISCLSCHGPGLEHVENPETANIEKPGSREFCGRCHAINPARSTNMIIQVDIKEHHAEKKDCIDCHNPHQVWEIKE